MTTRYEEMQALRARQLQDEITLRILRRDANRKRAAAKKASKSEGAKK